VLRRLTRSGGYAAAERAWQRQAQTGQLPAPAENETAPPAEPEPEPASQS
jgi:hypothetical protein